MEKLREKFGDGWYTKLAPFLNSIHFSTIGKKLQLEVASGHKITPCFDDQFRAFKECPYNTVKVVLLGLDPYPQDGVADGLAFSARTKWHSEPEALQYMIDAIEQDVYGGFAIGFNEDYLNPDLTRWANQGVLLLNQALSTRVGKVGAHTHIWYDFTRYVFHVLEQNNTQLVYILLGAKAKMWKAFISTKKNIVLTASHPSSAYHYNLDRWDSQSVFSQTNFFLEQFRGRDAKIKW